MWSKVKISIGPSRRHSPTICNFENLPSKREQAAPEASITAAPSPPVGRKTRAAKPPPAGAWRNVLSSITVS